MEVKHEQTNSLFWSLVPIGMIVILWAIAGLRIEQFYQAVVVLLIALSTFIYFAYSRHAEAARKLGEVAERADRKLIEADRKLIAKEKSYVRKLQHYVEQLEKSSIELRASREEFRIAANHDGLTGLANRNHFLHTVDRLMKHPPLGGGNRFAVLFLDLNRFKTVNDSLGHLMGDRLIVQVAERLKEIIGTQGIVARFGGDEFAVLLTDIFRRSKATSIADKIAEYIASSFDLDDKQVFIGASIGIAFDSSEYAEPQEMLRDADIAMYYAKESQKNWVIFNSTMRSQAVSTLELETDLRYAVERDELELFYQPIVLLDQTKLAGFEALVRWRHPTKGIISPDEFISVSEEMGLIVPMTLKLLRQACQDIVEWQLLSEENRYLTISVNISAKHFAEPELVDQIRVVLDETGIHPPCLKLELTEGTIMEDAQRTINVLQKIKDMGVKLSIDDFGTGYSSLSYLHRFPVDTLKIDRSFVSTMEDSPENGEIVRTVITLAKALKMDVIAEGIESIHQLHQLMVLDCEYGQGNLFSRPVPAVDVVQMFSEETWWRHLSPVRGDQFVTNIGPSDLGELSTIH